MGMRVSRRRALVSGVGAAALALVVGACSSSGSSGSTSSGSSSGTTSKSGKLTDVTLVIPSLSANQALGFIAQNGGYFKQNGLNVKIVNSGAGATAVAAVTGGSGQFVISGGSDILSAASKGQKLVYIARGLGGGQATQLVLTPAAAKKTGLTDSSTPAQKAKALDGLTIASASAASSWTVQATKAAATQNATIKWTYVQPADMDAAMKAGHIDGIVAAPPFTTQPVYAKTGVMWLNGPEHTFPGGYDVDAYGDPMVATTQSEIDSHPAVVKAFLKSILQAGQLAQSNPTKAASITKAATFPSMPTAEWNLVWASTQPLLKPDLTQADVNTIVKLDGFDGKVNPTDVFGASIVNSVTP
jgi:ABC-type nitrate/sulfonate/bicarbonate transport system substrate-binding protein